MGDGVPKQRGDMSIDKNNYTKAELMEFTPDYIFYIESMNEN